MRLSLTTETKTWFDMDTIQEATIRSIAEQETRCINQAGDESILHAGTPRQSAPIKQLAVGQALRPGRGREALNH